MPHKPTWKIDWSKPLYFQEPGRSDRVHFIDFERGPDGRGIFTVHEHNGREYRYNESGTPIDHGRYIANVPYDQLMAQAKVKQSRERAKRLKKEEEARIREQRDLAGDCYGLF